MRILFSFCLILLSQNVFCQFGVRSSYNLNNATGWNQFITDISGEDTDIFNTSLSFAIDYWLRLPNHRVEFYPYISYHKSSDKILGSLNSEIDLGLRQIGGGLYTHIYVLDLIGDCECPTFSKQGDFFQKGFFVVAGIGTDYSFKTINGDNRDGNFDFKASLGIGQDIGINDLITISPYIQYQYYPHVSWHELGTAFGQDNRNIETSLSQIQLGIRVGFRPDYK